MQRRIASLAKEPWFKSLFSLCYLEIAESACEFIQGITVKERWKKGNDILRTMTSPCFVIPDPDPPYVFLIASNYIAFLRLTQKCRRPP